MKTTDKIPTCNDYSNFLVKASIKFKISINEARTKYGLFTYNQWINLLTCK